MLFRYAEENYDRKYLNSLGLLWKSHLILMKALIDAAGTWITWNTVGHRETSGKSTPEGRGTSPEISSRTWRGLSF